MRKIITEDGEDTQFWLQFDHQSNMQRLREMYLIANRQYAFEYFDPYALDIPFDHSYDMTLIRCLQIFRAPD